MLFCWKYAFLLLLPTAILGQAEFRIADRFNISDGLPVTPTEMMEDSDGFKWLGTAKNGLFRFDGNRAKSVVYWPGDTVSQMQKHILALCFQQSPKQLWIGTNDGIFRFDLLQKKGVRPDIASFFPAGTFKNQHCRAIFQDRQGEIWASVGGAGLLHLLENGQRAELFADDFQPVEKEDHQNLADIREITSIIQDNRRDELLWMGTHFGLLLFDKNTRQFRRFIFRHPNPKNVKGANTILTLFQTADGRVFIGSFNGGLLLFDPKTERFSQHFMAEEGFVLRAGPNLVSRIFQKSSLPRTFGGHELWLSGSFGTVGFDIDKCRFSTPKMKHSLSFKDRAGIFWEFDNGLRQFHPANNQLAVHPFPLNPAGVESPVRAIRQQPAQPEKIWLHGQFGEGPLVFDSRNGQFQAMPLPSKSGEPVRGQILERMGNGWLANDRERLFFKPDAGSAFQPFAWPFSGDDLGFMKSISAPDGSFFISSNRGLLCWFQDGGKRLETFRNTDFSGETVAHFNRPEVRTFDHNGRLWLTCSGGMSIFDPATKKFNHVADETIFATGNPFSLQGFLATPDGKMWIAGNQQIGWLNPEKPEEGLRDRTQLPFQNLHDIEQDSRGQIWMMSNEGLLRFDPNARKATRFDALPGSHFFDILRETGLFCIGLENGLAIAHPDSLRFSTEEIRPYASWFKVFEKERPLTGDPFQPDEIRLAAHENFLFVGLSALGFFDARNVEFAWQLDGLNDDWVLAPKDLPVAAFTDLAGGNYRFLLKIRRPGGEWSERVFELKIHVATPFYRTWWAILGYLLLIGAGIRAAFQAQKRRLELYQKLALEQQNTAQLRELDQFKTRFFTNVTHEFRTPLTLILGTAQSLHDRPDARTRSAARLLERNGRSLLLLVNQLLDLSKIEGGDLRLRPILADVMGFVKMTALSFESFAALKNQSLFVETEPPAFTLDFDPTRLQQVLTNLLSNALKFTPTGGEIQVFAKILEKNGARIFQIDVLDNGIGIAPTDLANIFDRFFQADSTATRRGEGTGIGLALVRELVSLMHGKIGATSQPGLGSRFWVELPVSHVAPIEPLFGEPEPTAMASILANNPPSEIRNPQSEIPDFFDEKPVVLLVEDNPDLLQYLKTVLNGDYHLMSATNGREGLEKAFDTPPDVVLSDVMMPEMDGLEFCRRLKNDPRTSHVPVVLLTARATTDDRIDGLEHGADAWLTKPFDRADLLATLVSMIENRRRMHPLFGQKSSDSSEKNGLGSR